MFDWASRLFGARPPALSRLITEDGVLIMLDDTHADAERLLPSIALGYIQQLAGEERLSETPDGLLLPWSGVYDILKQVSGPVELGILGMPQVRHLVPSLRSENTLTSPDFSVGLDGWRDSDGRNLNDVSVVGGFAYVGNEQGLLPFGSYQLLRKLELFYDVTDRTPDYNRRLWGQLRSLAIEAGAKLDQFLYSNVILTPEKLVIELDRNSPGGVGVVQVEPWFSGAPDNWLEHFDMHSKVEDLYQIPTSDGIVQVIITPKVKAVLQVIKQMPGRRVAGSLGERFVSNPFAMLGGEAENIIDPEQFEKAREEAGIVFEQFTARVTTDKDGKPTGVGILIQSLSTTEASSALETFSNAGELAQFIRSVETRLRRGDELYHWRGYDLQLLGDTPRELETLTLAHTEWTRPQITIRYADVADLKRYSERVIGIGVQEPLVSPYIKRDKPDWFDDASSDKDGNNRPIMGTVQTEDGVDIEVPITTEIAKVLKDLIERAQASGADSIEWPELGAKVSVRAAREQVEHAEEAWRRPGSLEPYEGTTEKTKHERKELLHRANVESVEYHEKRANMLHFDSARKPFIPARLKSETTLMAHQEVGVAWMQNLLDQQAPHFCGGAVLADDMGLGKTLQLLTVIAWMLEKNPACDPILIVAPVSLLENWKNEANSFFKPDTFKMLALYGSALSALRETPSNIEEQLRKEGLVKFLKPNWLGDSKVVLTTYETLRDLEFSFAATRWSLMVCDEAQKIKNPAAMVTRAAKKQNVAFKIACTGTPVENSLADLWCLFDYIQPGLLGALNEFGERYRRPIECETEEEKARIEELDSIIKPQLLRRTKQEVAKDLKPKHEKVELLQMSVAQRKLYADALDVFKKRRDPVRRGPLTNHLGLLQYLRWLCTDPKEVGRQVFVPEPLKDYRRKSPKLDWLIRTLEEIRACHEKAIVFCEFREMQRMLVHYIQEVFRYKPDVINGDTTTSAEHAMSRQKRIDAFQGQPGFGVLILSPKAVGFGVNIQAANHVIHYTRSWNPALENQATDREV